MQETAFIALGVMTLGFAWLVVQLRNLVHAGLALGGSFVGVAGLYLLLNGEFIAAAQVLIYVGAITVLILFAVMITAGMSQRDDYTQTSAQTGIGLATAALVFLILGSFVWQHAWPIVNVPAEVLDTPRILGFELLTSFIIPFEVASVLLLAALVAAVVLAREEIALSVPLQENSLYEDGAPETDMTAGPTGEVKR